MPEDKRDMLRGARIPVLLWSNNYSHFDELAAHVFIVHSVTRPFHLFLWLPFPKFDG